MSAPRDAAARALAQLLRDGEPWPSTAPLRMRNLLLDACGSDHRALVELLLRVGRHGVAEALRKVGRASPVAWPAHRTRLVSLACGELFIEREIAAWAVDAWAVALGVIEDGTAESLRREYAEQARRAEAERAREEARAAVLARSQAALAALGGAGGSAPGTLPAGGPASGAGAMGWPGVTAGLPPLIGGTPPGLGSLGRPLTGAGGLLANPRWGGTAAGVLGQPSWAGGTGAGRVGAWRRGRSGPPRWRVAATPLPPPNMKRFFALFAVVSVCLFGLVQAMRRLTPDFEPPAAPSSRPLVAGRDAAPPSGTGGTAATSGTRAATQAAAATPGATQAATRAAPAAPALDRAAVSSATPAPPAAGIAPVGPAAVRDARSPRPALVPSVTWSAIDAGIAGRYRVEQRNVSVYGSSLCDPVADALAQRPLVSEEEFVHVPGQRVFALASRGSVTGRIEPDGVFMTDPHRTTHDNVRLEFRMVGRFTPDGFFATTMTASDATLRYRERQQCVVRADLQGTRLR